jgi:hypothetical protein
LGIFVLLLLMEKPQETQQILGADAASPEKSHFSRLHFTGDVFRAKTDRIKPDDPYRLVTEEGTLCWCNGNILGVGKIIASIQRVGFVEEEFTLWVVPEAWKTREPKAGDEKVCSFLLSSPDDGRRQKVPFTRR